MKLNFILSWLMAFLSGLMVVSVLMSKSSVQNIPKVISLEEGMKAVRQFEKIPDLKLEYLGRSSEIFYWAWPLYIFYSIDNRLPKVRYGVDPYTGQVVGRKDMKIDTSEPEQGDVKAMISPQQAVEIVKRFVSKRDPSFHLTDYDIRLFNRMYPRYSPDINVIYTYEEWSPSIDFLFRRKVSSWDGSGESIYYPGDEMRVILHSLTGQLAYYMRVKYPIHRQFEIKVNAEQAKEIALGCMKTMGAMYPAKHRWTRPIKCAYAYRVRAGFGITIDYPDFVIPVWYVSILYTMEEPDLEEYLYCGGHEYWFGVHAETGEVLCGSMVLGTDEPPVKIDKKYLDWYRQIPLQPLPWYISVDFRPSGDFIYYPFPLIHEGELYIKPTFAWLMKVKVERVNGGYLLKGKKEVFVSKADVIHKNEEVWLPLSEVAKASRAKVEMDLKERWLRIETR